MIITDATLRQIDKGFQGKFLGAIGAVKPIYNRIATVTTSSQAAEVYGDIGFIPSMKELIGEAITKNLRETSHTIANKEFESTVAVPQAAIERDSLGIYAPRIATLGTKGEQLKDKLCVDLLINGFTATDYTGGTFFSTTHKHFSGGKVSFSNKGTKKISATNFADARAAIRSVKDENGEPLELGDSLVLVVSPTYEKTAREIVIADTTANGASNVNKGTAELIVSSRLASAEHNWFLLDVSQPLRALILQEEKALQLLTTATGLTTEQLLTTHKYLWQAYWRGNAGYGLPQLAWGSTGADAA
jgi:phage major head subunit gpT-like protein